MAPATRRGRRLPLPSFLLAIRAGGDPATRRSPRILVGAEKAALLPSSRAAGLRSGALKNMDRRTLLAVLLIGAILLLYPLLLKIVGVERYMPRRPEMTAVRDTLGSTAPVDSAAGRAPVGPPPAGSAATEPGPAPSPTRAELRAGFTSAAPAALERSYFLENQLLRAEFEARGATLKRVELKRFRAVHGLSGTKIRGRRESEIPPGDRVVLAGGPTLALDLGSGATLRPLTGAMYAVRESTDAGGQVTALSFTARDTSGALVRQTYRIRPGQYALDLEVAVEGVPLAWRLSDYTLTFRSWPLLTELNQVEDERQLQATSLLGSELHRDFAPGMRGREKRHSGNVLWAGVLSRYFLAAVAIAEGAGKEVVASSSLRPLSAEERALLGSAAPQQQLVAENRVVVGLPGGVHPASHLVVYAGPRDYALLRKLGLGLERGVDLGWSWVVPLSKLLLGLLKGLYRVIPNYGVAILLLATLARVLLHPLNMASIKSMRAMQRLQPEMERLRAKYKENPQGLNSAMLALYRENKVNPAGGCLPLLLQMPLFFALYAVLFHAIELRQASFALWIQDLSAPDVLFALGPFPVRLLPILMMGSGLLQQKLTPTDPRQTMNMYVMNVFMVVFFYNLPSGLVLYWTVMNLLTALQQWLALREDGGATPVKAAPTPEVVKKQRPK